jgi:activator of HSP90 ATPase
MFIEHFTRREFSTRMGSFLALGVLARTGIDSGAAAAAEEVSRTSEAIHQEIVFNATPERVYDALTDATRFSAVTAFSSVPNAPPAQIAHEVGGSFALFGGHILGRHVDLVPGQRVVQAWRTADWAPGVFSIALFDLKGQGAKTTLLLTHTGFPNGQGEHLAAGWHANYWEPLRKYLA